MYFLMSSKLARPCILLNSYNISFFLITYFLIPLCILTFYVLDIPFNFPAFHSTVITISFREYVFLHFTFSVVSSRDLGIEMVLYRF